MRGLVFFECGEPAAARGGVLSFALPVLAAREAAWLLVGFQRAWLFDGHGHTIRMNVGVPTERAPSEVDEEAFAFAAAVVKEGVGESHSPE